MQSSNDTAVIEAIEASKNFFFYGLQPTKGLDKLDQVSGTTSRSLEAPRRWGTRLGVWCKWSCLSTAGGTPLLGYPAGRVV